MRKLTLIAFISLFCQVTLFGADLSLYNSKGLAQAYISKDKTIYLWSGKPSAYIDDKGNIYGFNGKHKGWYEKGILYQSEGLTVGGIRAVFNKTQPELAGKGAKRFAPFKAFKQFAPFKPILQKAWAGCSLKSFLVLGTEEIGLFDSTGSAIAYIAEDWTVYSWKGKPLAYVDDDGFTVYGFNGEHLGWFDGDMFFGRDGRLVGAVKEVLQNPKNEPFKGFKEFKPFKNFKRLKAAQPAFVEEWSQVSLSKVLFAGAK